MSCNWSWFTSNFFGIQQLNCWEERFSECGLFTNFSEYIIHVVRFTNYFISYYLYTLTTWTISEWRKKNSKRGCILSGNSKTNIYTNFYEVCEVLILRTNFPLHQCSFKQYIMWLRIIVNQILLYLRINSIIYWALLSSNKGLKF